MGDPDRSNEQPVQASCPVDDVAPCREARTRRIYRSPELRALGSLATVQGGPAGPVREVVGFFR